MGGFGGLLCCEDGIGCSDSDGARAFFGVGCHVTAVSTNIAMSPAPEVAAFEIVRLQAEAGSLLGMIVLVVATPMGDVPFLEALPYGHYLCPSSSIRGNPRSGLLDRTTTAP